MEEFKDGSGGVVCTVCKFQPLLSHDIDIPDDRLQEICEAEKDGRLVVLPCKVGDAIYRHNGRIVQPCIVFEASTRLTNYGTLYSEVVFMFANNLKAGAKFSDFGKTVFLTKESAETALKEASNDEQQ